MHCGCFDTTQKGNHSATLAPTVFGGRRPLPCEICAQTDPPFEARRLRQISAYNVSTVSEKSPIMTNIKSTTNFPASYIDGVRTLPPQYNRVTVG